VLGLWQLKVFLSTHFLLTYLPHSLLSIDCYCDIVLIHPVMAARKKSDNCSLQAHDIYFQKRQAVGKCPTVLQDLFKLVIGIKDLKADHFGGYDTANSNHSLVSCTAFAAFTAFSPRQQYERELKFEADELSIICSDNRRPDDNEEKWVQELGPIVFYRFDREREEKHERDRHHHW
jgi:hypothetical protein